MKTNKIYLVIFMLILYFSFLLQGTTIISNLQDKKDNKNVVLPLIASKTLICEWYCTWGGFDYDNGYGVAVDSSGNVYLAGRTESFGAGDYDMILVKYDVNGTQQWNQTWGGNDADFGSGVAVDFSGNVYLAGYTYSFGAGGADMVLVKYVNSERPLTDELIMIFIIIVSIASAVGIGIAITYFIRKHRKIVE